MTLHASKKKASYGERRDVRGTHSAPRLFTLTPRREGDGGGGCGHTLCFDREDHDPEVIRIIIPSREGLPGFLGGTRGVTRAYS